MTNTDLRTAIEGRVWVVENVKNRAKSMETIFALDDMYLRIKKDSKIGKGPLLSEIKSAIHWIRYKSHVVGTSCCRRCRHTQWQNCKCFVTKTNAFSRD